MKPLTTLIPILLTIMSGTCPSAAKFSDSLLQEEIPEGAETINVPLIEGLHNLNLTQLLQAMQQGATKGKVDRCNWHEEFPYSPECNFFLARSETHIVVLYKVKGLDLRAKNLDYNGSVWQDSCCEFFVADPTSGDYYNFELNCIGSLLGAKGSSREGRVPRTQEELDRVIICSSLPHKEVEISDEEFEWSVAMSVPFELIGVNPLDPPKVLRANFYKCGDLTAHPHFLSWSPIATPNPDFHRPEFFGMLILK